MLIAELLHYVTSISFQFLTSSCFYLDCFNYETKSGQFIKQINSFVSSSCRFKCFPLIDKQEQIRILLSSIFRMTSCQPRNSVTQRLSFSLNKSPNSNFLSSVQLQQMVISDFYGTDWLFIVIASQWELDFCDHTFNRMVHVLA